MAILKEDIIGRLCKALEIDPEGVKALELRFVEDDIIVATANIKIERIEEVWNVLELVRTRKFDCPDCHGDKGDFDQIDEVWVPCTTCGGTGESPKPLPVCPTCDGERGWLDLDPMAEDPDWIECPTCPQVACGVCEVECSALVEPGKSILENGGICSSCINQGKGRSPISKPQQRSGYGA